MLERPTTPTFLRIGVLLALGHASLVNAALKPTNAQFDGWDENQLKYENSNVTFKNDGEWTQFFASLAFDRTTVDPEVESLGNVTCASFDTDGDGLTWQDRVDDPSTPDIDERKLTSWAGFITLALSRTDTGYPETLINGFPESRCWELAICDRNNDGAVNNADLTAAPPWDRGTIDITGADQDPDTPGIQPLCLDPNRNTDWGYPEVDTTNSFLTLVTKDATIPCTVGNCAFQVQTELYVSLDRDCDNVRDTGAIGNGPLVDGGTYGYMPAPLPGNSPEVCFFAEGLKPNLHNQPVYTNPLQARFIGGTGNSGEKTVNYKPDVQAGDFGDLDWEVYGTAAHWTSPTTLYLGAVPPDEETTTQTPYDTTGDDTTDTDDEDALSTVQYLRSSGDINVTVRVSGTAANGANLCGWMDLPDTQAGTTPGGSFDPAEEVCITVGPGSCTGTGPYDCQLTFPTFVGKTNAFQTNLRLRTCTDDVCLLSASSTSDDGEVEDWRLTFYPTQAVIGDVSLDSAPVETVLAGLVGDNADSEALLVLLSTWDSAAALSAGGDRASLMGALTGYLDPDGDGQVAVVRWDTLQEKGTVGFYVERRRDGEGWHRVNDGLLQALVYAPQGGEYWLADPAAVAGKTYHYRLVEQEAWGPGSQQTYGPWKLTLGSTKVSSRALPATGRGADEGTEDAEQWAHWRGLGQGYVARMRVVPKPKGDDGLPRQARKKTVGSAQSDALWLRTGDEGLYSIAVSEVAALSRYPQGAIRGKLNSAAAGRLENAGSPVAFHYDGDDDAVYFVGESYKTLFADRNAYRLDLGDAAAGTRMDQANGKAPKAGTPQGAFLDSLTLEQDRMAVLWSLQDEDADYWFWDYLYAGYVNTRALDFDLPGAAAGGQGEVRIQLSGWTDFVKPGNDHKVSARLNGVDIGDPMEWDGFDSAVLKVPLDHSLLLPSGNKLEIVSHYTPGTLNPGQWINRIEVDYWRRYRAQDGQLWLSVDAAGVYAVDGFHGSDIRVIQSPASGKDVWRDDIQVSRAADGSWQATFEAPTAGDYLVVDSTALKVLAGDSVAVDEPSDIAAGGAGAAYLIIAPRAFAGTAEALKTYRSARFGDVRIAWLEDIYDEFAYGLEDPYAIGRFMDQVSAGWSPVPEYVTVVGKGTVDHLDRGGYGDSLVPVLMVWTPWGLAPSDNRYFDSDRDGQSAFAFGRIPVTSDVEGLAYVQKLESFESGLNIAGSDKAVVAADNPDRGGLFHLGADALAEQMTDYSYRVDRFYHTQAAVRSALTDSSTWEAALVAYEGHGSPTQLGDRREKFLASGDVAGLNNQMLPVFAALTCAAGNDSQAGFSSLASTLVSKADGGAIVSLASSGLSFDSDSHALATAFLDSLMGGRESAGAALRQAKQDKAGEVYDYLLDIYQLVGEPAVRLH